MVAIDPQKLEIFQQIFTPLVSDVMDRLGLHARVLSHEVQSIPFDPKLKVAGFAYPCRVISTSEYVEINTLLEMVDSIPKDAFVVVAADADTDAALWGGLMSTRAKERGAHGAVVNGGIRDFEQIDSLSFPVFGKYRCIKDIRRRGYMAAFGVDVMFDGQPINLGDVIFGDANGVVVIPQEEFEQVYEELIRSLQGEKQTSDGLLAGRSAQELFSEFKTF